MSQNLGVNVANKGKDLVGFSDEFTMGFKAKKFLKNSYRPFLIILGCVLISASYQNCGVQSLTGQNFNGTTFSSSSADVVGPNGELIQTISLQTNVNITASQTLILHPTFNTNFSPAYQWYFNNQIIPNATSSTLSMSGLSLSQSGNYVLRVTDPDTGFFHDFGPIVVVISPDASCIQKAPTLTLLPPSQTVKLSGSANYTLQIKNNDPANCTSTVFYIAAIISKTLSPPSAVNGFTATFNPSSISMSPGQSSSFTLTVSTAKTGFFELTTYFVIINATRAADTSPPGSTTGTFILTP